MPLFDDTPPGAISPTGSLLLAPCRAVAVANLTVASTGVGTVVDGVTLALGDRLLLTAQSTASQNGPYTVGASALTRATDADASAEFVQFMVVPIGSEGTTYKNTRWYLATAGAITLGSTALSFLPLTPGAITPGGVTFDNTAPGAITPSGVTFDNTAPGAISPSGITFDNTAPGAITPAGMTFSNTPPGDIAVDGAGIPGGFVTPPVAPVVVDYTTTLQAGVNYRVQVGNRATGVNVILPASPTVGQQIEVVDVSGQAATYVILVQAGSNSIETIGNSFFAIDRADAVFSIYWTGAKWKKF